MALVVFAISVVGLVALESRSLEAQRAAADLREAERVAQEVMADMMAQSYVGLATTDFMDNPVANFPYTDYDEGGLDPEQRLRAFRRPPADIAADATVPGALAAKYLVFRRVDDVPDPNNPVVPSALILEVTVLWIDDSNGTFPPPAGFTTTDLELEQIDPTNPATFLPYVQSVQLRRVRANDAA